MVTARPTATMDECAATAALGQFMNGSWPAWIGNLANLVQIGSPIIALIIVLVTRFVAGRARTAAPRVERSTIRTRHRSGAWSLELGMRTEDAGELVEVILMLTGWTQVRLVHELRRSARLLKEAEPLGLDPVTVNRWRRGRQRPSAYYSRLLQHLYHSISAGAFEQRTHPTRQTADEAEDMKRRRFLQYLTVLSTSVIVDRDRLGAALRARSGVDSSLLDSLGAVTRGFARQWHAAQPQLLRPCVQHHFEALHELSGQSHPAAIAKRLSGLSAEAAALLGWEVWMAGDRSTCDAYYALARELAQQSGRADVAGFVLVARSFACSALFDPRRETTNQPAALLDEAVAVSAGAASPYLQAFALTRRAEERAAAGGTSAAAAVGRDLDDADSILATVRGKDDGFFHYMDLERLAGTRGTCAALLGDTDEAVRILSQVIGSTTPSLAAERSVLITDLASVYARMNEVDYACELLGRSLSLGHRSDVNRTERIVGVRHTLLRRWASSPSVRRLDEQLELHRTGAA